MYDTRSLADTSRQYLAPERWCASLPIYTAHRAISRLEVLAERPPCAVFLGERNSGKSTAINRLLGTGFLPTDIITSTRYPTRLSFAPEPQLHAVLDNGYRISVTDQSAIAGLTPALFEVGLPVALLKRLEIMDTPADFDSDALAMISNSSSQHFFVWCTLATQAWKASELTAWLALSAQQRRHGVLAVTAMDRITDERNRARLLDRLAQTAGDHFSAIAQSSLADDDALSDQGQLVSTLERIAVERHRHRARTIARLKEKIRRLATPPNAAPASITGPDRTHAPAGPEIEADSRWTVARAHHRRAITVGV